VDLGLEGKVALVTAASKGLGRAAATGLAAEGAKVAVCARHEETLQAAAREISAVTGSEVLPIVADLTRAEDIERLLADTVAHYGGLQILVTNSGGPPAGYFADFSDADWQGAVSLTLMSAIRLIRAALPHLRQSGWGRIVNITSISVKQPLDNLILSNAIRAAVVGLAKTLSRQVAAEGITVNNVCPNYILTERVRQLAALRAKEQDISVEEAIAQFAQDVPVGRIGQPQDLADLIVFLASERASYINGTTIQVDGGRFPGLL
jgi:3-oxoacyl-[acyl-carrier protein] reductase